jgi:hypothetical protein
LKDEYPAIPIEEQIFRPPKPWTAWPLPPDEVPRRSQLGVLSDQDEQSTYKRKEFKWASTELEDVLLGITLKFAKERFEDRDLADEDTRPHDGDKREEPSVHQEVEDGQSSMDSVDLVVEEKLQSPPEKPTTKPVVSADDERSRIILRPSIRHTLSKLDEILMALHHARKTCRRYDHSDVNTDDETTSIAGSSTPSAKKPQGRPRKFADLPDRSITTGINTQDPNDASLFRTKKTNRGRPQKVYPRLEGENQQEYLVRIARIQKKPLPSFAPPLPAKPAPQEPNSSPERGERARSRNRRATIGELEIRDKKKLGLRDWSEMLGSAALVGFPEDVIARATQRCANLFREGMIMRVITEAPLGDDDAYAEQDYRPEMVPAFSDNTSDSSDDESERCSDDSELGKDPRKRISHKAANNVRCPISGCPRKQNGFQHNMALEKHLQQRHEIPKEEIEEYILPSDEEMEGAVHTDGFLRPIKKFRRFKDYSYPTKDELVSEGDSESGEDSDSANHMEGVDDALSNPEVSDNSLVAESDASSRD